MPRLIPKSLVSRLILLVTTWLISAFIAISITMLFSLAPPCFFPSGWKAARQP